MTFGQGQCLPSLNHSVTSFGFFHICVPLAAFFPCTGQCVQEIVKGGFRPHHHPHCPLLESQRPCFPACRTDSSASASACVERGSYFIELFGGVHPLQVEERSRQNSVCTEGVCDGRAPRSLPLSWFKTGAVSVGSSYRTGRWGGSS